jgi:indolepyruvate ferredoxin oxidoreductase alpha subunit
MVADDISCWSSAESEQNTRPYSYMFHIPTLEPADPQETKDFIKLGYEISEQFKIPVMLRTTTRVVHQSAPVLLGEIPSNERKAEFVKNNYQFSTMPPGVLQKKRELLDKIKKIQKLAEESEINPIINFQEGEKYDCGLITSGVAHLYAMEAMQELGTKLPVLKIGFFYPLPEQKIKDYIKNFKKILVVEEVEPYIEKEIRALAKEANCDLEILGKDVLPEVNEFKTEIVNSAVAALIGKEFPVCENRVCEVDIEKRYPKLCPGCPHGLAFMAVKKAAPDAIIGGDIGCYMIAGFPPNNIQDFLISMGSSIAISHGIVKSLQQVQGKQKLITFMGDGTFLHSGIHSLLNTVFNKSNPLIIILDNSITAMTGHQPNPGVGKSSEGELVPAVKIEDIVSACGVKNLKVVDPVKQEEMISTIKEFLNNDEVSVIISRRPCLLIKKFTP